ncbi:hypothetical protein P7H21_00055 [Paenibacillus larvae]|nr:hypothetical protein [Paenibacillus larvae]MDT2302752.1 hypothetical protein [Paenibacillus larvae]
MPTLSEIKRPKGVQIVFEVKKTHVLYFLTLFNVCSKKDLEMR